MQSKSFKNSDKDSVKAVEIIVYRTNKPNINVLDVEHAEDNPPSRDYLNTNLRNVNKQYDVQAEDGGVKNLSVIVPKPSQVSAADPKHTMV